MPTVGDINDIRMALRPSHHDRLSENCIAEDELAGTYCANNRCQANLIDEDDQNG